LNAISGKSTLNKTVQVDFEIQVKVAQPAFRCNQRTARQKLTRAAPLISRHIGIDYRGIEFEGVTIRDLIYPVATVRQFIFYPAWALLFTMMVGVYPAAHVARIKPAEAMRRSL